MQKPRRYCQCVLSLSNKMIYAFGGSQLYTDNYMIERYDIERDYWVTLHVLLDFEFNFQMHKVLFNAEL